MPLLGDTGVLYALADRSDAWHARVKAMFAANREPLLAPVTILPEVTYLVATRLGANAERAFLRSLVDGELTIEPLASDDLRRALEVLGDYADIGFVDATVIAMAERLKVKKIATTDRRHFTMVKPRHVAQFTLVPAGTT